MVVYVSPAELNGGILQFSAVITRETSALTDCVLFLPDAVNRDLYKDIEKNVVAYPKVKTLKGNDPGVLHIAERIMSYSPEAVVFLEDSILMQQLNAVLSKKRVRTAMVVHDVEHHPYRKMGFRKTVVDIIRRKMMRATIKSCYRIILLSANSDDVFRKKYRVSNTVVFRLPAHVPEVAPKEPPELKDTVKNYYLFFGRIDKYKGIGRLCSAYLSLPDDFKEKNELVIAGKGELSDEEMRLVRSDRHIHLLNRFIDDDEMIWLFMNSAAVVMPYIEASQSGVLPIAYKFGKPVIVSDLRGLTENVSENKTGYVFKTNAELTDILLRMKDAGGSVTEEEIEAYYKQNFLWQNNLNSLLKVLRSEKSED